MSRPGWVPGALRYGRAVLACAAIAVAGGLIPAPAQAQAAGSITGRVTDARTGAALEGIEVRALGTRRIALTDGEGSYALRGLAAGSYTVRFTWIGYREHEATVEVGGQGVTLDVALEAAPIQLGEIRVTTASRQPERVLESPAAVLAVTPDRIRDLGPTGQTPLLIGNLPGVQVMQSGVNSFNVNTRGFNALLNRRMLVLVDGRDVSAPIVGTYEWPDVAVLEDAARVEVVKGPGSALYGANAFNGVLNILTPTARQAQGTRLTLAGGELSTLRVDGRHAGVTDDLRWGYGVKAGYARSVGWDRSRTDLGDLEAEYADAVSGALGGEVPAPGFEVVPLAGQSKSAPFGVAGAVTGDPDPLTVVRGSGRIERYLDDGGVVTAEAGFSRLENQVNPSGSSRAQVRQSDRPWGRLAWASDDVNVMAYYTARDGEQVDLSTGGIFEDRSSRLHLEAQVNQAFADERGRFVAGASARREAVDSKGTVLAPRHDGRTDTFYALFGQVGFDLAPSLELILAGRFDDGSLFDGEVSPKAALVWKPGPDHALRFSVGRAYLVPSAAQRFVEFPLGPPLDLTALEAGLRASPLGPALLGVPEGTLLSNSAAVPALAIGQEDLPPEEVTAFEVGYKAQLERTFLTADVHYSELENFFTDVLPGLNPAFGPWTAPSEVPEAARAALEGAVAQALPGVTRLGDGTTALVFSQGSAGRATQWGVDLGVGAQVSDEVRLDGSYSYLSVAFEEGSFLGADSVPANTPAHTAHLSASYADPSGLSLSAGLTLVDGFDFQNGVWKGAVPGRQSIDLASSYRVSDDLRVGLSVTNALDQQRFHYFGGSLVGRRLLASLTWER